RDRRDEPGGRPRRNPRNGGRRADVWHPEQHPHAEGVWDELAARGDGSNHRARGAAPGRTPAGGRRPRGEEPLGRKKPMIRTALSRFRVPFAFSRSSEKVLGSPGQAITLTLLAGALLAGGGGAKGGGGAGGAPPPPP